jgi:hypothetical protein
MNRNVFFSLRSFVMEYLGDSMKRYGLVAASGPNGTTTLSNAHCIIYLENIDNNYVRFDFASVAKPETQFSLPDYLNAVVEGGAAKHRPKPSRQLPEEEQFRHYLKSYATILEAGLLEAPLAGDFSWEPSFRAFRAEYERVQSLLVDLVEAKHPEAQSLLKKMYDYDISWMDDVERIIEKQSPKS